MLRVLHVWRFVDGGCKGGVAQEQVSRPVEGREQRSYVGVEACLGRHQRCHGQHQDQGAAAHHHSKECKPARLRGVCTCCIVSEMICFRYVNILI
jgi:hypothetical protein